MRSLFDSSASLFQNEMSVTDFERLAGSGGVFNFGNTATNSGGGGGGGDSGDLSASAPVMIVGERGRPGPRLDGRPSSRQRGRGRRRSSGARRRLSLKAGAEPSSGG